MTLRIGGLSLLAFLILPSVALAQTYEGSLFETHSHMEEDFYDEMLSLMETHGVTAAITFNDIPTDSLVDEGLEDEEEDKEELDEDDDDDLEDDLFEEDGLPVLYDRINTYPNKIVPFFDCDCDGPSDLTMDKVQAVLDADTDGILAGFGEIALYEPEWAEPNIGPNHEVFRALYPTLSDAGLWIMLHLRPTHGDEIRAAAGAFPNQRFLIHGGASAGFIAQVLADHANVYFTADTSALLARADNDEGNNLLFASDITGSADFLAAYEAEYESIMDRALRIWRPIIEAHPDRVFWGTDVAMDWHFDPDVYAKILSFSRAFIARLDPAVQEQFAVTSAQALFTPVASAPGDGGTDGPTGAGGGEDDDSGSGGCSLVPAP